LLDNFVIPDASFARVPLLELPPLFKAAIGRAQS
jgi:hypothetical protein